MSQQQLTYLYFLSLAVGYGSEPTIITLTSSSYIYLLLSCYSAAAWYATSQSKEEFCSGWESRPSKLQWNAKLQNTNIRCWTWTEATVWSSSVPWLKWSTSLYVYDSAYWKYNEAFRLFALLNRTAVGSMECLWLGGELTWQPRRNRGPPLPGTSPSDASSGLWVSSSWSAGTTPARRRRGRKRADKGQKRKTENVQISKLS